MPFLKGESGILDLILKFMTERLQICSLVMVIEICWEKKKRKNQ